MFKNLTIKEVKNVVSKQEKSHDLVSSLLADGRKGLLSLAQTMQRELEEKLRYQNLWLEEEKYWTKDINAIGLDEAGRGPLAGPVVAAAVVFKSVPRLIGLKDSKKLTEIAKEELLTKIENESYIYRVSFIDNNIIDEINILNASKLAMVNAVNALNCQGHLLIDGNFNIEHHYPQTPIIKGDSKVGSIASASVLAKVYRDRHMHALHKKYPVYNFAKNKGYPTEEHYWAIRKYGPSPVHRISFKGVVETYGEGDFTCGE